MFDVDVLMAELDEPVTPPAVLLPAALLPEYEGLPDAADEEAEALLLAGDELEPAGTMPREDAEAELETAPELEVPATLPLEDTAAELELAEALLL